MDSLTDLSALAGAALLQAKQTVAIAESSAAGLISAALLAVPGASAFYRGGVVSYTIHARQAFLGIGDADMAGIRPSTEPYALLLARRVRERLGTDWGVGETGGHRPDRQPLRRRRGPCLHRRGRTRRRARPDRREPAERARAEHVVLHPRPRSSCSSRRSRRVADRNRGLSRGLVRLHMIS